MILDSLSHAARYEALHPFFAEAFAYLKSLTPDALPPLGEPVILRKGSISATSRRYDTRPAEALLFEAHRNDIDLHFLLSGREAVFCCPRQNLPDPNPYDSAKDCETAAFAANPLWVPLRPKDFLILFPGEAHRPGCILDAPASVSKIVMKIRL